MARLEWDKTGERFYHTGTKHGVLYPMDNKGAYPKGVVWNGLTAVTESPDGADLTKLHADDMVYAGLRAAEEFKYTIESYMYPPEFEACDGSAEIVPGVTIGQQRRLPFGFSWVTSIGNDTVMDDDDGYIIHIAWNSTASPSEKSYETVNDSPDAITFSWECDTTPVNVADYKPTAHMEINSLKTDPAKLKALEDKLYGTENTTASLPTPDEVIELLKAAA